MTNELKTIRTCKFERNGKTFKLQTREFPVTRIRFYWWSEDGAEWFGPFTTASSAYFNAQRVSA